MDKLNKNILGIGLSTVLIRVVGVVQSIILMRLIVPEEHGIFAAAVAALAMIGMLSEDACVTPWIVAHPEQSEDALPSLRSFAVLRSLFIAGLLIFLAPILGQHIATDASAGEISYALTILSIGLVIISLQNPAMRREEGRQNFKKIVTLEATAQIIAAITGIVLAWYMRDIHALLAIQLIPFLILTLGSYLFFPRTGGWKMSWSLLRPAIVWGWPFWIIALLTTITAQVDDLIISRLGNTETLGFYAKAYFWSTTTSIVIMQAFTRALFPRIAANKCRLDLIQKDFNQAQKSIILFLAVLHGILFLLAQPFVLLIGGESWLPMVPYFKIFLLLAVFRVLAKLSGQFLGALGESRRVLAPKFVEASLLLSLAYPCFLTYGAIGIAYLTTALYFISWVWHRSLLNRALDSTASHSR